MESFKIVKDKGIKVIPSIALTCTQENFKKINEIYEFMKNKHNVKRFSAILVRDEAFIKPQNHLKNYFKVIRH